MDTIHRSPIQKLLTLTLVTVAVVRLSMIYLDAPVARGVMKLLGKLPLLHRATANMPDLLLLLVCATTGSIWGRYLFLLRLRQGPNRLQAQFLLLAGTAIPAAFLLKFITKYIFGRVTTRSWLLTNESLGFHWFDGSGTYVGFPSGHMAVFTACAAAITLTFPRQRTPALVLLFVLGTALIVTDYHFVSDILAGGYVGLTVTLLLHHLLPRFPQVTTEPPSP